MKKNAFSNNIVCIFDITLFAYDYLFEQQGNSHDEYLVNKSTSNQGADVIIVHHLGQLSQDSENLSNAKWLGANLCLNHLGRSNNESCPIGHLLVTWQHKQPGAPPCILRTWT